MTTPEPALRFDLNESPLGPPDAVARRIASAAVEAHTYPLELTERVVERVADHFGVRPDEVLISQGIDECVDRLVTHFASMRFVTTEPGFNGYSDRLKVLGREGFVLRRVGPDFALEQRGKEQLRATDFVLLADPDNPTGVVTPAQTLAFIEARVGAVLVDRTYADYADVDLAPAGIGPGRFRFHSLSKSFALAGLRVGVLLGPSSVIGALRAQQWFCSTSSLSLVALEAALDYAPLFRERSQALIRERRRLVSGLRQRGFDARDTQTNFVLIADAPASMVAALGAKGMRVADMACCRLHGHVRVCVRTPADNQALLDQLVELYPTLRIPSAS